ncbi:Light-sensor Protein kinase [Loxospora ochrophaea]|nr:Light-sensor Protein kinase [Loxospora ochrophaea]
MEKTPHNSMAPQREGVTSPGQSASESPFAVLSPGTADRVFPIRSVISVDPNSTPSIRPDLSNAEGFPGMVPSAETAGIASSRRSSSRRYSSASLASIDQLSERSGPSRSHRSTEISGQRGVISPDETPVPGDSHKSTSSVTRDAERAGRPTQTQLFSDIASSRSNSRASTGGGGGSAALKSGAASIRSTADEGGGIVTARFKHVVTDGGHAVISGRDGETLQRCEDEPIHIPGAIQGFGLLIALQEVTEGKLLVRVVSENSKQMIGYTPKDLFALENFCDILTDDQADNLLDHLDFIRDEDTDTATNGPEVFTLSIRSPLRKLQRLWCAMHINDRHPETIICEFELEDDPINPLVPAGSDTPEPPEDTLQSDPSAEEYAESTVNSSKPLRVLRSARKRKGEAAAMEVFNIMSQVQEQLANAPNVEVFLKVLVGVVKELTGFHRVMIYQFDQAWNGRVVTELVDPRATKDLYKGLNFPASDIPKQARDLYKVNKVRLLYDRDLETARLVCRTIEDIEQPLDLTYAYLRAISPIHIKYLANMAVRASMSISINAFSELWGLIACHSYGSKGMRVSFPIRKMCRLIGDSASRNIERLSYASRLQARKLINTVPTAHNPSGYIIASSDDLLKLFDADHGLLSIRDETKIMGKIEHMQEALAMLEYFRLRKITSVLTSLDIKSDFPDLRYPPGFSDIAGVLLVPLSVSGSDFIVFFRKGQLREVKWAGNPYEKFIQEGTEGYLEPRKSFKTWRETVVGKCREWTEEQIETAAVLCLVYGKFIEVWRQKEVALHNSQLTKLLLANSAHEVRTPLNAIINYLEIAMEGTLDGETRENLAKSHSASKSLIYVINDLLDLTKTEKGNELIKDEVFDLPLTVQEAADMFQGDAKRKAIEFGVTENPGVPQHVLGDQRRVRQAVSNVIANAIKYTSKGGVKVELWPCESREDHVEVEIVIEDTGVGMSAKKLDALFQDLEQVQTGDSEVDGTMTPDLKAIEPNPDTQEKRTLGLGLALVARIIRNMDGQLRLKSEEGRGSRFVMQLGFDLPSPEERRNIVEGANAAGLGPPAGHPSTPPVAEGEIMLVHKSAQKPTVGTRDLRRQGSMDSLDSAKSAGSMKSFKTASSGKSEVDRLIEAIQEPHMVQNPQSRRDGRPLSTGGGSLGERPLSASANRPSPLYRSQSYGIGSPTHTMPGEASVMDSATPVRPIRVHEESMGSPTSELPPRMLSQVSFDIPDKPVMPAERPNANNLRVLVAEDDPINSRIVKKRLEKFGHEICLTVNGEDCSHAYGEKPAYFDIVLMDMQMPIVDGLTSTKMIRSYEKTQTGEILSPRAALNSRVPIFAVSASLIEKDREIYIEAGFDGWILKPIDFNRMNVLIKGIVEEETRESCLYQPGEWERGGWFAKAQPSVYSASTRPLTKAPSTSTPVKSYPSTSDDPFDDPISKEQARLDSLETDAVHSKSTPQDPGESGNLEQAGL